MIKCSWEIVQLISSISRTNGQILWILMGWWGGWKDRPVGRSPSRFWQTLIFLDSNVVLGKPVYLFINFIIFFKSVWKIYSIHHPPVCFYLNWDFYNVAPLNREQLHLILFKMVAKGLFKGLRNDSRSPFKE